MTKLESIQMMFEHGIITVEEYQERLEKYSKDIDRMFELYEKGRISAEELQEFVNK